jgi:hypothetical protein
MDAAAAPRYTHGGYSLRFSDGFYEKVSRGYIESFAVHLLFKVDNDSQGLTRQMGPLSSIMQAGREPCKFVDSPARFLNLYGRLYGFWPISGYDFKIYRKSILYSTFFNSGLQY